MFAQIISRVLRYPNRTALQKHILSVGSSNTAEATHAGDQEQVGTVLVRAVGIYSNNTWQSCKQTLVVSATHMSMRNSYNYTKAIHQ